MATKNLIGLDNDKAKELAGQLNLLLANLQVFYANARGFHWLIKGEHFFELHIKFEELFTNTLVKIDEVAERVLTLGFDPLHAYSDYLQVSAIKESQNVEKGKIAVALVLKGLDILLNLERKLSVLSNDAGDEGTNALMSDYIREQEKLVWMYSAYLDQSR